MQSVLVFLCKDQCFSLRFLYLQWRNWCSVAGRTFFKKPKPSGTSTSFLRFRTVWIGMKNPSEKLTSVPERHDADFPDPGKKSLSRLHENSVFFGLGVRWGWWNVLFQSIAECTLSPRASEDAEAPRSVTKHRSQARSRECSDSRDRLEWNSVQNHGPVSDSASIGAGSLSVMKHWTVFASFCPFETLPFLNFEESDSSIPLLFQNSKLRKMGKLNNIDILTQDPHFVKRPDTWFSETKRFLELSKLRKFSRILEYPVHIVQPTPPSFPLETSETWGTLRVSEIWVQIPPSCSHGPSTKKAWKFFQKN